MDVFVRRFILSQTDKGFSISYCQVFSSENPWSVVFISFLPVTSCHPVAAPTYRCVFHWPRKHRSVEWQLYQPLFSHSGDSDTDIYDSSPFQDSKQLPSQRRWRRGRWWCPGLPAAHWTSQATPVLTGRLEMKLLLLTWWIKCVKEQWPCQGLASCSWTGAQYARWRAGHPTGVCRKIKGPSWGQKVELVGNSPSPSVK